LVEFFLSEVADAVLVGVEDGLEGGGENQEEDEDE
jgi:hypothetical protein